MHPKCKYCRRVLLRKVVEGPEFRKHLTMKLCEYCDKLQRRRF